MELFRCVFISLVAFLSAVKVQSTENVSLSYAGHCTRATKGHSDNYLRADCSATKSSLNSSQCEVRADGSSKGTYSTFQILKRNGTGNITCIQFTHPSGKKYALKVVNQSRTGQGSAFRVVFETYQGCSDTTPKEFLFVEEHREEGEYNSYFRYKPFNNLSMCLGKDINCTSPEELSLLKIASTDERQLQCFFTRYFFNRYKRR